MIVSDLWFIAASVFLFLAQYLNDKFGIIEGTYGFPFFVMYIVGCSGLIANGIAGRWIDGGKK